MAKIYHKKASEILNIEDEYMAYCYDEAISQIIIFMDDDKVPRFDEDKTENKTLEFLMS